MARAAERLREAGLRVTVQRIAMLMVLDESSDHLEADTLRHRAQAVTGGLSLQATYNVLRALTDAGLIRITQIGGQPARYEIERNDNHHHFVCRKCRVLQDVRCEVGGAPCMDPELPEEYAIDEASVTFWGVCPACGAESG